MFSIAGVFLKLNGELVPPTDHEASLRKSLKKSCRGFEMRIRIFKDGFSVFQHSACDFTAGIYMVHE